MSATIVKRWTPDGLLAMPSGELYELLDGNPVEKKSGAESSLIAAELMGILLAFIKSNHSGRLFADGLGYQCFAGSPELTEGDVLPGFRCRVAELFAELGACVRP